MSARDKLASMIPGELGQAVADEILAEHARELAAAIRAEYEGHPRPWSVDPLWAADLIDPDEEP